MRGYAITQIGNRQEDSYDLLAESAKMILVYSREEQCLAFPRLKGEVEEDKLNQLTKPFLEK